MVVCKSLIWGVSLQNGWRVIKGKLAVFSSWFG